MARSVLFGALAAVLVAIALGVGGLLLSQRTERAASVGPTEGVVVVIAGNDSEGTTAAQLVSVVTASGITNVSPDTTVTIPGTDYHHLRDAYAFGGGRVVAAALATSTGEPPPFVAISQPAWQEALNAAGGARVTLPERVDIFDGATLTTLPKGEQVLSGVQVAALLKALPYLPAEQIDTVRPVLNAAVLGALAANRPKSASMSTDLTPDELRAWWDKALLKAVSQ